ncbi:MAG TPA: hypothetical protein VHV83_06590, partial [Armatimonadota bacterium]|nr:hypothetical protein [Armatimonadota bacterium]
MRHHDTSVKLADRLCNIAKWVLIYSVVFGNIWGFFSDHMRCADLLIAAGASVAFCAGAAWIFSTRRWQTFVATCFGMQPPVHSTTPIEKTWVWCLVGLLIVIGNLAVVEIAFPFFFTQDDNFSAFLPNVLHAYRNILQGILPTWNPYQYLGIAHASNPQCTFFYPPMFLSYLASRLIFRSEMYTLDIFAWLHLLGGYLIVFLLLRKVEVRPWYAMAGAIAFTLSGFFLILGRGWVSFAYYTVYEALLILQLIALQRGNASWKWLLGTGAIIGLSYYLGCPQMWAYMLLFFTVAVVLMMSSGAVSVRHGLLTVPAVLLGLAVASPLLLPQYQETMRFIQQRTSQLGEGIGHGLLASFFPYPLSFIPYDPRGYSWSQYGPIGWVNGDYQYLTQLYYSGTLFSVIAAVVLLAACGYVVTRCVVQRNVWLGTALIAANLALGAIAGGWLVLSLLPVLSKFRGPFKLIGFLNLFLILGAAIVVERLLRHYRVKQWLEYAGVALVCMLMTYHCLQPHPAFFRFGDKPYPALPATYQPIVTQSHSTTPARIYSFGPYRHGGSNFVWALSLNFPTVYGIPALTGYDPLLSLSPEMTAASKGIKRSFVSAMQAYGVRWIIMTYHCPQKVRG